MGRLVLLATMAVVAGPAGRADLFDAVLNSRAEEVEKLLNDGADANITRNLGVTVLHDAIWHADTSIVRSLLEHGASAGTRHWFGSSPLDIAAEEGRVDVIQLLLERGADPNSQDDGATALHKAILAGQQLAAAALVEGGTKHAVETAVAFGDLALVDAFVRERGANAVTLEEMTLLHWAAAGGQRDAVGALLGLGADVATKAREERTAIYFAAQAGDPATIRLLVDAGAIVNPPPNEDGEVLAAPLAVAAQRGHQAAVEVLLELAADARAGGEYGRTALHCASDGGNLEVVNALLGAGADANATCGGVMEAVGGSNTITGVYRVTPLHFAAGGGHVEVVSRLLAAGANKSATDNFDRTPRDWALKHGHTETAAALLGD